MLEKLIFWESLPWLAAINTFRLSKRGRLPNTPTRFPKALVLQEDAEWRVDEPRALGAQAAAKNGLEGQTLGPRASHQQETLFLTEHRLRGIQY